MPRKATTKVRAVKRDTHGLIVDSNVNYIFNEDGFVDWRKMVKTEYLVPNKDRTSETDVTKLSDYDLLILLGGIKELAQIRGYTDVTYNVVSPHPEYVVATCSIKWIPNFETEGREVTFSAIGDAAPHNTHNFAKHFLGPIAENRAFVRCVRNFLNVHIVGDDEIDKSNGTPQHPETEEEVEPLKKLTPNGVLENLASSKLKCDTYTDFKDKLRELWTIGIYKNESAKDWATYDDIPAKEARLLINIIKND